MNLLIPGDPRLDDIFCGKAAVTQGSSFDLTIAEIIDDDGKSSIGPYVLKPGHMVHVYTEQIFCLPANITGHVTYKTSLTKKGIWALTVGIVDPGWNCPISTTLLNFSRSDYPIVSGESFLRVSFFEHEKVPTEKLRRGPGREKYVRDLRKDASSLFSPTFLNREDISREAGEKVLSKFRNEALAWVALIVFIITAADVVGNKISNTWSSQSEIDKSKVELLEKKIELLQLQMEKTR